MCIAVGMYRFDDCGFINVIVAYVDYTWRKPLINYELYLQLLRFAFMLPLVLNSLPND
jgi:hypothetical protein